MTILKRISCLPVLLSSLSFAAACTASPVQTQAIDLLQRVPLKRSAVEGHSIAYMDVGSGPAIVLFHGLGGSIWHWEHQQTTLSRDYRLVTPDLLGAGESDKPDIPYTPQQYVRVFGAFLDHLGIHETVLVGNSMGAGLAMALALTEPERVSCLVLISGFPAKIRENLAHPTFRDLIDYQPPLWLVKAGNWLAGRWFTKRALKTFIHDPALLTPLVLERSYKNRSNSDFLGPLLSAFHHVGKWETAFGPRIGAITQPTLIIWGEKDSVFPISVGESLHQQIRESTFEVVSGAGHLPQWEKPDRVNRLIRDFLTNNPSCRTITHR